MSLEKLNEILNQLGLNMVIEGDNVFFYGYSTKEKMVTGYEEVDENNNPKKFRTECINDLLNGQHIWVVSDEYIYYLRIRIKDGKYYLDQFNKSGIQGYNNVVEYYFSQNSDLEELYSIIYKSRSYNLGYDYKEFIVESFDGYGCLEYKEEDVVTTKSYYHAGFSSNNENVTISNNTNIDFKDVITNCPDIAKILEVIAPHILAKCLKNNDKIIKKGTK